MKLSYINYLRLINNKLIREGVDLSVDLRDDMSISELEEAKTILESYCYFNDVLTKCDSAYALDVTDGCKAKLYTDTIRDEVLAQYKEKFDSALALLYQDRPNPLDKTATVEDLSNYLQKNGKSLKASDFAIEVDSPVSEEPTQAMQYADIFAIKPNNELIYTDESEDSDDDDFDYSDEEEVDEEGIDSSESEEVSEDSDEDFDYSDESESAEDDIYYDFSSSSDETEEEEDEFDYSDEEASEGTDIIEELPLDESDEQVMFDFGEKEGIDSEDDDFSYDDEEEFTESSTEDSEEDEFDYSESEDDEEFNYDDESSEDNEEDEFNYDDESVESDEDDEFNYDEEESSVDDVDYSDDGEEDEFSYDEDEVSDEEDDTSYEDDDFNYDEDDTLSESSTAVIPDAPVFNVGGQTQMGMSSTRQKEDFEKDAELIEGIVEGGTKLLKGAGEQLKKSLFSKKP